jgi:hypothetical protein
MTDHQPPLRRSGCLVPLAVCVSITAAVCLLPIVICASILELTRWLGPNEIVDHSTHYRHEILVSLPSPTGAWTAIINEETVEGLLLTSINADVALISKDNPAEPIDLLGVDTSGHAEARPRISWSAPNVLRVTVPNISYLKVLTRHADGVDVDLHFEPDDPAARAAWLKKIGQPPE